MMMLNLLFFLLPTAIVRGHYCSNSSNGLVAPSPDITVSPICDFPQGEPISLTIDSNGQPESIFQFGGQGQAGKTYLFSTCGFTGNDVDTGLSIWNSTGDLVACDDDSCVLHRNASSLVFTLPDEGTFFLRPWIYSGTPGAFEFGYFSGGGCSATQTQQVDLCDDEPCSCANLELTLQTDAWSNETSLVLESLTTGSEIWNFPEGSLTDAFHSYVSEEECLDPAQCYQLTISDLWADGICCFSGLGSYEVFYAGVLIASGGDFGESATHTFGNCQ